MKRILLSLIVLSVLASSAMATDKYPQPYDAKGQAYVSLDMRGVDVSSGITTTQVEVAVGNSILVDMWVVTATTGTTGTIYLRNNAGTRFFDIGVEAVALAASKWRSIWRTNNIAPLRMTGDWSGIDVYTSSADITVYIGYIKP